MIYLIYSGNRANVHCLKFVNKFDIIQSLNLMNEKYNIVEKYGNTFFIIN